MSELRVFLGGLIVWSSHIQHHSAFAGDLDVPQDVGNACDWVAYPSRKRQEAVEVLVTFEGGL